MRCVHFVGTPSLQQQDRSGIDNMTKPAEVSVLTVLKRHLF